MDTPTMRPGRGSARKTRDSGSDDTLLTEKRAARVLRVSPRTLQGWRHRGTGPPYVKLGTAVRYRRGDLKRYILDSLRGAHRRG